MMTKKEVLPKVGAKKKALAAMHLAPKNKTLLLIAGPTAVGKTGIAIQIAQALNTAIISADSRQCYQGMRIGTAQPSEGELLRVPHYFINAFPVTDHISAARYEELALGYLEALFATNDTVIACGGTGLYIKALCNGLDEMPEVADAIVKEVEHHYQHAGIQYLQESIQQEDPRFYAEGEIQNPARLMRALSFVRSTGESILGYHKRTRKERDFRIVKVGLELPRVLLYERINHRVDAMMDTGLLEEVSALYSYKHLKNLQTVGYAELFDYLDGKHTLERAVTLIRQHTRNYAKRQMTWFRKDNEMNWLRADDADVPDKMLALAALKNL